MCRGGSEQKNSSRPDTENWSFRSEVSSHYTAVMSTSYILPLKAPNPLPATGVDVVTFKVWKNTLIAHIQQDKNHHHFMEDGKYSTWQAAEFGRRIAQLHDDDPEKNILDAKEDISQQEYDMQVANLLSV